MQLLHENLRGGSIPISSRRAISALPPRTSIRRGRSTLRRVGRWRKRPRWVWCKLNAIPKTARIIVFAATILAVFSGMNLVYQVLRKPTEVFAPVSGAFNKTPAEPGANMRLSFASIPPQRFPPSYSPRSRKSRPPAIRSRAPIGGGG